MNFFDLHCDTAYKMYVENKGFLNNNLAVSVDKAQAFDNWTQTFAIWISEEQKEPYKFYKNALKHLKENLCGKVNPIFAIEGGSVIEDDIARLHQFKKDAVRFITLTWNGENLIAGGVNSSKGLTDFGAHVIKEMNALKIAVDLSHLNDKSFYKVIEKADTVLATHSNCRAVCKHKRNLTDEQIKLIVEKNGIIGLNFYPLFLGDNFYEDIYRNIYHLIDLGCENNIAIGSDFDGADMCKEMKDISKIMQLYENLLQKGIKKPLLDKIFYKNAQEFMLNL